MSPKRSTTPGPISDLQLGILRVLWDRPDASVDDVRDALPGRTLAPTTVATMLFRLEKRQLVSRHKVGRRYVYRARVGRDAVVEHGVARFLKQVFRGDFPSFVAHLLQTSELRPGDLEKLRKLLEQAHAQARSRESV